MDQINNVHTCDNIWNVTVHFYIYFALPVQDVSHELGPDCSLNQFSGRKTLFVLEAGRNDLNSTGRSVYLFGVIYKQLAP